MTFSLGDRNLLIRLGLFLTVVTVATTVVFHVTQQVKISFYRGKVLYDSGEYRAAVPFFSAALQHAPGDDEALRYFALSAHFSGQNRIASVLLQRVVSAHPDNAAYKKYLAESYAWGGQYDKAIVLYRELLNGNN